MSLDYQEGFLDGLKEARDVACYNCKMGYPLNDDWQHHMEEWHKNQGGVLLPFLPQCQAVEINKRISEVN